MNRTKFGNPNRFDDRVSVEVQNAMKATVDGVFQILIAMGVRYRSSPRGLAAEMLRAGRTQWKQSILSTKRGHHVYRQTGVSDGKLRQNLLCAAQDVHKKKPYDDWGSLEEEISKRVAKHCGGSNQNFAARQAAADVTQVAGWVKDMGPGVLPKTSPTGPGAEAGYWLDRAGKGDADVTVPSVMPYFEQTCSCEYSKLVCRMNFPECAEIAVYKPAGK